MNKHEIEVIFNLLGNKRVRDARLEAIEGTCKTSVAYEADMLGGTINIKLTFDDSMFAPPVPPAMPVMVPEAPPEPDWTPKLKKNKYEVNGAK